MLIRGAIQMAVTLGFIEAGQWLLDKAIIATMKLLGASEQQAKDIAANGWLQFAEAVGLGSVAIKSKTPSVIAEKLGFTSKGFKYRSTIIGSGKLAKLFGVGSKITAQEVAVVAEETVATIAKAKPAYFAKANAIVNFLLKTLAIPVGIGVVVTNTIDFGAWSSSAYQESFQKFFRLFGLEPDVQYVKSKVLSGDMFNKIYAIFEEIGSDYITDPRTGEKLPFNRENLIDIADFVGAQAVIESGQVTTKQMLGLLTALVVSGGKSSLQVVGDFEGVSTPAPASTGAKVFSTVISEGKITPSPTFTARPDDMIEDFAELRTAAQNNLATYLTTVAGRIAYEISIVSSVITKDGFKQVGSTQQIISGTYASGKPKYKTVTNKFAKVKLYMVKEPGQRVKIGEIVLGPTNAATLNPSQRELSDLAQAIHSDILTTDIREIAAIESPQEIIVETPQLIAGESNLTPQPASVGVADEEAVFNVAAPSYVGQDARNLYEWYTARGEELPPVQERSQIYEDLGLGLAAFYTGTAEQNTKLLAGLKKQVIPEQEGRKETTAQEAKTGAYAFPTQTWYNNGKNGTEREVYGQESYRLNRELDKKVGALIANPSKRDIPPNLIPDFYTGKITLEQLKEAVEGSPDYRPEVGPLIDYGQGSVPYEAS